MEPTSNTQPQPLGASVAPRAASRPPLYHYTGIGGFLGMLKTKKIWLTSIHYLNDSQEYNYALGILEEVLAEYDKVSMDIGYLRSMVSRSIDMQQIYTFSFSAAADLLSQWRAYCPDGGYSFSFLNEQLDILLTDPHLELYECIYDREKQKKFIMNSILGVSVESYSEMAKADAIHGPYHMSKARSYMSKTIAENFIRYQKLLPVIKHPAFSEEQEWRIIAHYHHPEQTHIYEPLLDYREGKGMIIPYLNMPIPIIESRQGICFEKVFIGPTPHEYLATASCNMLIKNRHHISGEIRPSKVPYRNF